MTDAPQSSWGPSPHRLLSLAEAWDIIADQVCSLTPVMVPFSQAAGRVLAEPVIATDDYPSFDKALMDGFAVRSADCVQPDVNLTIVNVVAAGSPNRVALGPGEAVRINTGAPLPDGADAVVPVERVVVYPDGKNVTIGLSIKPGKHISRRGSDRRRGEIVLAPIRMGPAQLAAAAAAGADHLAVGPEVTVAIVVTGDELVPVGATRERGQIYESNGPMLSSLMRQFGGSARDFGIARDNVEALKQTFAKALECPIVVTAGGMSMGTLDLVPQALADLGVQWLFHGVEMRPGKPVAYGRGPRGQHVFGLPGNPASSFVCAWLFVRAALRGLLGFPPAPPHRLHAMLTHAFVPTKDHRPSFTPAVMWNDENHGLMVESCTWSGSGDPFGLALGNCLLVREDPSQALSAGQAVEVIYTATEI